MGQVVAGGIDPVPLPKVEALEVLALGLALDARSGDEGSPARRLDERGAGADIADELLNEQLDLVQAHRLAHPCGVGAGSQGRRQSGGDALSGSG